MLSKGNIFCLGDLDLLFPKCLGSLSYQSHTWRHKDIPMETWGQMGGDC